MSKIIHRAAPDRRGSITERLERAERQLSSIAAQLPTWIANGVLEGSKKMYRELYEDLAGEHGRVFEVQEAAFLAIVEQLHARLSVLEEAAGITSPDVHSLRETVDAIGEYFGEVGEGRGCPWNLLSADAQRAVIAELITKQRERRDRESATEEGS